MSPHPHVRRVSLALLLACFATAAGCMRYALTPDEEARLEQLAVLDIHPGEGASSPPAALGLANAWGPLGLLLGPDLGYFPLGGTGNFFLAEQAGGDRGQWWLGVLNSVTWPVSALWSVPQVIGDAEVINQRDTIFFYQRTLRGAADWQRLSGRATWMRQVERLERLDPSPRIP
jgi:hypothetical protein